jgi:hypothetical protein
VQFRASFGHGALIRCAGFGPRPSLFITRGRPYRTLPPHEEEVIPAVNDLITIDAVTTSALGFWTGEVAAVPRCVSPLAKTKGTGVPAAGPTTPKVNGTGLHFVGTGAGALGVGAMWTDQVQGIAVRVPVAAVQGDPPRRTPPRC